MKTHTKKEIERVRHTKISKMNFFIVDMIYRGMHAHSDLELMLQLEGEVHIETPEESFEAGYGDVVLFNPDLAHSLYAVERPCRALVLQIDLSFCKAYFPDIRNIRFLASNMTKLLPEREYEELKRICYNIGYNYFGQYPAFEFRCMSDVNRLFSYLLTNVPYRVLSDEEYLSVLHAEKRMERIVGYVNEHYMEKISLSDIAESENLSLSYLSHFFKDNLHQNFQSYVNSLRFEHAVYLLQKTDMRILDICLQSGFSDSKYLNNMFRDVYGITPKEFRQKQKEDPLPANKGHVKAGELNEYHLSMEEGMKLLRSRHHFHCDDGIHPHTILQQDHE